MPEITVIEPFVTAILGALLYGSVFFYKSNMKDGEPFDTSKFASTMAIALLVALLSVLAGVPLDAVTLEAELLAYAGVIAVLDALYETIRARYAASHAPLGERSG